jgi:hypothetical protein
MQPSLSEHPWCMPKKGKSLEAFSVAPTYSDATVHLNYNGHLVCSVAKIDVGNKIGKEEMRSGLSCYLTALLRNEPTGQEHPLTLKQPRYHRTPKNRSIVMRYNQSTL